MDYIKTDSHNWLMNTGAAMSFDLIQACRSGLVLYSIVLSEAGGERERERLSLSAFLRTEDIGVHIVHISRLIITYTLV